MYTSRDLRHKTKEILDLAKKGEPVKVTRNQETYIIRIDSRDKTIQNVMKRLDATEKRIDHLEGQIALPLPTIVSDGHKVIPEREKVLMDQEAANAVANMNHDRVRMAMPVPDELSCCQKAKPCKHWAWNGIKEAWVNTLSGRERSGE